MMKLAFWIAGVVGAALVAELGARLCGLGRPLLYERTVYGYRVAPGQSLRRFGNRVDYNAFGLRSEPVSRTPAEGVVRVLCVGDSITFGSTNTDQAQTYPYRLQSMLEAQLPGRKFEVLNASAGGWATENEEGWMAAHGLFGSGYVVLQVASHDLFQERAGPELIGTHPAFPLHPPALALQELVVRYVLPRLRDPGEVIYSRTRDDVERVMSSLDRILARVRAAGATLVIVFVEQPTAREPEDDMTQWGKARFAVWAARNAVTVVRPAAELERAGGEAMFFDGLHPNPAGNEIIAATVAKPLSAFIDRTEDQREEAVDTRSVRGAR